MLLNKALFVFNNLSKKRVLQDESFYWKFLSIVLKYFRSTPWVRREGVKGRVGVAGWAVELETAPLWALHRLSGAVTDSLVWQQSRVIVVDKVAEDASIRERHSEVLHLNTHTQTVLLGTRGNFK